MNTELMEIEDIDGYEGLGLREMARCWLKGTNFQLEDKLKQCYMSTISQ